MPVAAPLRWRLSHCEAQRASALNVCVTNHGNFQRLAVQLCRLDIQIACRVFRRGNHEGLAIRQVQGSLFKGWAADHVVTRYWIHWIETHCSEYVPRRHLPAVLIAQNAGWRIRVCFSGDLANLLLCFPG